MKTTPNIKIIAIINYIILTLSFSAIAQKNKDVIASLDTSAFKGKLLLNNAIRFDKFFDPFREKIKKVNANQEVVLDLPADYFNYLSEILEQADLKEKPLTSKLKNIIGRKGKDVTGNNTISISIINTNALLLSKEQVVANQNARKNNVKADSKDYETIEFIAAGLLQSEAFQGNLNFEIDPSIIINNLENKIQSISIDFNDGKGFQDYEWKQQIISHQFNTSGDVVIKIKLSTQKGTYITNCPLKIHFVNRQIPSYTGTVSSPSIKGGRVSANANVAGAEYAIFMGCDGILDKPIIIAEGFDPENSVNIDYLVSKYQANLRILTNNGYDLVFVNYNDGTDYIENNAQALKRVINEINAKKIGSAEINKLSIIGESMSGLVARWALREMENAGQNHQVARLICFDTPHKGANTSPGLSYLAYSLNSRGVYLGGMIRLMFNIFAPALNAINSPAATQQLLFQTPSMTPHPNYASFRANLNNLGNGGYPSQCENIAFINGALDGKWNNRYDNRYRNDINDPVIPGEKNLDTDIVWGVCYDFIDCWTNQVNVNTEVYNEDAFGLICDWTFSSRSINLPYNLDRLAGGFNSQTGDLWGQFTSTRPNFAFVPTFSAVDYRGSLNTDADYSININNWLDGNRQVRADKQNLTPFKAIYGNNDNYLHSFISGEADGIRALAINEFGINPNNLYVGCVGCTAGSGGLNSSYFDNPSLTNNANTRTNTTREIAFSSDEGRYTPFYGSGEIPPYGIFTTTNHSARWEGSFEAPITATYTFNMRTDDGVRLWLDGVQRVNDWGNYPPRDHTFQIALNAGERKSLKIEWFQGNGGYEAKFMWSFNGVQSIVPACRLFSTAVVPIDCNFTVSTNANPSNVGCGGTSTLFSNCSGSGCSGVSYVWSDNNNFYNGSSVGVTLPSANGAINYSLAASKVGCANKTDNTSITVSGCGGGCTFTEGQPLFNWYGENIYAHKCGTKYFVTTDAGSGGYFKPQHWLTATNYAEASCFEENDPRPAGCTTTPPNDGGSCIYTDGQFLLNFGGEIIEAKYCGGVLYARATWGGFKPRTWLVAAGFDATAADCFASNNPGCGALRVAPNILEYENFEVYPNPTNGNGKVGFTLQTDESIWLNLYDSQGKSIMITNFEGKAGHNIVEFDLQNHPSGAYFINIQSLEKREVKKVIKIN